MQGIQSTFHHRSPRFGSRTEREIGPHSDAPHPIHPAAQQRVRVASTRVAASADSSSPLLTLRNDARCAADRTEAAASGEQHRASDGEFSSTKKEREKRNPRKTPRTVLIP